MLITRFLSGSIPYTGVELAPHWISTRVKEFGSAVVAFRGPCAVDTGEMVDMEDRNQNFHIQSKEMLHFLGEWFDGDLLLAVARQRLLIAGFAEELQSMLTPEVAARVQRDGNDLYLRDTGNGRAKLSVSIVTASAVSTLFHFGVNVDASGAPVRAVGLLDLGVDVNALGERVLARWKKEWESMEKARCKVAPR